MTRIERLKKNLWTTWEMAALEVHLERRNYLDGIRQGVPENELVALLLVYLGAIEAFEEHTIEEHDLEVVLIERYQSIGFSIGTPKPCVD